MAWSRVYVMPLTETGYKWFDAPKWVTLKGRAVEKAMRLKNLSAVSSIQSLKLTIIFMPSGMGSLKERTYPALLERFFLSSTLMSYSFFLISRALAASTPGSGRSEV